MSGMFPVCMLLVKGCQTLVMDSNQPTATIIGEYSASYHHGTLFTLRREPSDQNLA